MSFKVFKTIKIQGFLIYLIFSFLNISFIPVFALIDSGGGIILTHHHLLPPTITK